jgi:hypothetical protein
MTEAEVLGAMEDCQQVGIYRNRKSGEYFRMRGLFKTGSLIKGKQNFVVYSMVMGRNEDLPKPEVEAMEFVAVQSEFFKEFVKLNPCEVINLGLRD